MEDNNDILKQFEELKDNKHFGVPEGYFEEFPNKIRQRISTEKSKEKVSLYKQLRPQLALAASFAALFVLAYAAFSILTPKKDYVYLSENEIITSLESDIFEIDESELITALNTNEEVELITDYNLTEDEIIEYLTDEGEDFGTLISDY